MTPNFPRPKFSWGSDPWRGLDAAARAAFPVAGTVLGLLLLALPLGLPEQAALLPAFLFATVYFWSLFRPAAMTPALVFGLGLFADLLGGGPIGLDVLLLLLVAAFARRWRRGLARQSFLVVWLAFSALAAAAAALSFALTAALTLTLLPVAPALIEAGFAIGFYPLLAVLLTRIHRGLDARS
jgi:rod shape-determining protein MreD